MKNQKEKKDDGIPDSLRVLEERVLKIESKIALNITRLDQNDDKINELKDRIRSQMRSEGSKSEQVDQKKRIKKDENSKLERAPLDSRQISEPPEGQKFTDIDQMIELGKRQAEMTQKQNIDEIIKLFETKFDQQKKKKEQYTKKFMKQILGKRVQVMKDERKIYQQKIDKTFQLFTEKIIQERKKIDNQIREFEEKVTNITIKGERQFFQEKIEKNSQILEEKLDENLKKALSAVSCVEEKIENRIKNQNEFFEEKFGNFSKEIENKFLQERKKTMDEANKLEQKVKKIILNEEILFNEKKVDKISEILEQKLILERKKMTIETQNIEEKLTKKFIEKQSLFCEQKMREILKTVDQKVNQFQKRSNEDTDKLEQRLVARIKGQMDIIQKIQTQIHISNINAEQLFEKSMEEFERKGMKQILEWKERKKQRFSEQKIRMDRIKHMVNENPEKFVDINSLTKIFKVEGSTITLEREIRNHENNKEYSQILLTTVIEADSIFSFTLKVPRKSRMMAGVVDRLTQRLQRSSFNSNNAVLYECHNGQITYDKSCRKYLTNEQLKEDMELMVEVDMRKSIITFIIKEIDRLPRPYRVFAEILSEPHRQFVPYFEMLEIGDSVTWLIE